MDLTFEQARLVVVVYTSAILLLFIIPYLLFNKFGKIVGIVTGKLDSQKIIKNEGFYPEDINFGIQPDKILSFLNVNNDDRIKLLSDISYDYEYNIEDLYKYMRSAIVFVVAQR